MYMIGKRHPQGFLPRVADDGVLPHRSAVHRHGSAQAPRLGRARSGMRTVSGYSLGTFAGIPSALARQPVEPSAVIESLPRALALQ